MKLSDWARQARANMNWGERSRPDRWLSTFLTITAVLLLGYIVLRYKGFSYILKEDLFHTPGFFPLLFCYVLLFLLAFLNVKNLRETPLAQQIVSVFCIAALPRLALFLLLPYVETGDYANFAALGRQYLAGDYSKLAECFSTLPDFMGLSMLYSVPMRVFNASTDALRLCNCMFSACSCVLIFLIGRRYDARAGLYGALLYAFYPASILAAETVGNPVSSLTFLLLSIFLLLLAISAKSGIGGLLALLSGCSLLLSQYLHPSSFVTVIAVLLFLLPLAVNSARQRRAFLRIVFLHLGFFTGFLGLRCVCNAHFDAIGLRTEATGKQSDYYVVKLVMGLNPETNGNYNASDIIWCGEQPPETRVQAAFERIRSRLPNLSAVLRLVDTKIVHTWMTRDTNYSMFFGGLSGQIEEFEKSGVRSEAFERMKNARTKFASSIILLDFFYVAALYVFALFGVLFRKRALRESDLFIWIFLGFAGAFILFESQSRYRYPAMPMLCLLAGIGIFELTARTRIAAPAKSAVRAQPGADECSSKNGG